ncbi:MAG TPA: nuclear transport factor 2 family protein [Candidatus Bathyarchaeia archaeon]|nr:nuclear transport factor 2 family protein [Candidatus Bathyarchaeia archaeon]
MTDQRRLSQEEIADRLEIADLLARYCHAIDSKQWELLDGVFTPDARIDYTTSGGIQGRFPEVKDWLAKTLVHFPMTQHLVTNLQIEIQGDRATSRAYFYNPMGEPKPEGPGLKLFFVGGYYLDKLTRTPAGWRISERFEQQAWMAGR